jgi:hypothetical protein
VGAQSHADGGGAQQQRRPRLGEGHERDQRRRRDPQCEADDREFADPVAGRARQDLHEAGCKQGTVDQPRRRGRQVRGRGEIQREECDDAVVAERGQHRHHGEGGKAPVAKQPEVLPERPPVRSGLIVVVATAGVVGVRSRLVGQPGPDCAGDQPRRQKQRPPGRAENAG